MALRNKAFHQLRQLFQQHTARWQHELPDLTKPQYAVMRAIADKPGIEQVALIEAAVSTKATLAEMLARMENRGLVRRELTPLISGDALSGCLPKAKRYLLRRYPLVTAWMRNFWGV